MEYADLHGDGTNVDFEAAADMFTEDTPENKYLFSKYGTKNSWKIKEAGGVVLSPSGLTKFFNNPEEWHNDRFGTPTFNGNTNTVLGNAVHASIESILCGDSTISRDEVEWWLMQKYAINPDVDKSYVLNTYQRMVDVWMLEDYSSVKVPIDTEVEVEHQEHLKEDGGTLDIWTAGTADAVRNHNILIDWKTCGNKPTGIGNYKHQLMQYARAFKKTGQYEIDKISIVYIQKPTKTIGPRLYVFQHTITSQDWIEAEYFAELQVNTLLMAEANPELAPLIFRPNPMAQW